MAAFIIDFEALLKRIFERLGYALQSRNAEMYIIRSLEHTSPLKYIFSYVFVLIHCAFIDKFSALRPKIN